MAVRHHYIFTSTWNVPHARDEVYEGLRDIGSYPRWWRQVRAADEEPDAFRVEIRSFLPYSIRLRLTRSVEDPVTGILEARLEGDLVGSSRWTITSTGDGTRVEFFEEVDTAKPLLRSLDVIIRPLLQKNHLAMMRAGEAGLTTYLAGR